MKQNYKMSKHSVYTSIVNAVKSGRLEEPFTSDDFKIACPGFGKGTYRAFLWKHRVGNHDNKTELFIKVSPGRFKLVRPFKYDLE